MAQFNGETEGKAVVEAYAKEVEGKTCASEECLTSVGDDLLIFKL